MNIFDKVKPDDFETFVDDPEGQRIILDCDKCGMIVRECRYNRKVKMLTWKCPRCKHISNVENFDLE